MEYSAETWALNRLVTVQEMRPAVQSKLSPTRQELLQSLPPQLQECLTPQLSRSSSQISKSNASPVKISQQKTTAPSYSTPAPDACLSRRPSIECAGKKRSKQKSRERSSKTKECEPGCLGREPPKRPKRKKFKCKKYYRNPSLATVGKSASANCCACCTTLAEYFSETARLIRSCGTAKDTRLNEIFSDLMEIAGCLGHDLLCFIRRLMRFIVGDRK